MLGEGRGVVHPGGGAWIEGEWDWGLGCIAWFARVAHEGLACLSFYLILCRGARPRAFVLFALVTVCMETLGFLFLFAPETIICQFCTVFLRVCCFDSDSEHARVCCQLLACNV